MKPDEAIERVREWRTYNFSDYLPEPVVIAETDWLSYVQAMAASLPKEDLAFPSEEDVLWEWPEGVLIVFAEPLEIEHTIISRSAHGGKIIPNEPVKESQRVAALCIAQKQLTPTKIAVHGLTEEHAIPAESMYTYPTIWIGTDPSDTVQGYWLPGTSMRPAISELISESSLMLVSIITALGHRLTWFSDPHGTRGERRRAERELPGLRVLELASGASVQRKDTNSTVHWSHRWMVRGHWRLQPYGPGRSLRKAIWIDPYVKGPEGTPLDVRPTIWERR